MISGLMIHDWHDGLNSGPTFLGSIFPELIVAHNGTLWHCPVILGANLVLQLDSQLVLEKKA